MTTPTDDADDTTNRATNGATNRATNRATDDTIDEGRRALLTWLWRLPVLAVLAGAGYGLYEMIRTLNKAAPGETPVFEALPPERVASPDELSVPYAAKAFVYAGVPALLLRLPEAVPGGLEAAGGHYAAFSRICTHQGCIVSLTTNLEAVAIAYNYRSTEPVLTCPCHFSVFDPLRAGAAVSGPAVRPLRRIALELQSGEIYAVGLERV